MQIQITGRHMKLGDALRGQIEAGLEGAVSKYFERTGEANVVVSQQGYLTEVDCNVHLPSGIILQSSGKGEDPYTALDESLTKMEKRVRRYKRRLKDHHRDNHKIPSEVAAYSVLNTGAAGEDTEVADAPLTVAETSAKVSTMSVSEAVMQLELQDVPALMFRNASHSGLNMVYRRSDGNIGWVDPENSSKT